MFVQGMSKMRSQKISRTIPNSWKYSNNNFDINIFENTLKNKAAIKNVNPLIWFLDSAVIFLLHTMEIKE